MLALKCCVCKETFQTSPYTGEIVQYDGKYWCVPCLVKKRTDPRTRKDKWLPLLNEDDRKIAELREKTRALLDNQTAKDSLYTYLEEHYNVSFFPKYFFIKMTSIFDGSFKGLTQPIPASDLLDMFQQRQFKLDKDAAKRWGSNQPEPIGRINYDLAVLMGKYGSYLMWKKSKEAEQKEVEKQIANNKLYSDAFVSAPIKKEKQKESLADIIDDLFD